jgi:hypothetical protein
MATFVLVHGGWQGGWSWRRVVPHLRASGHEVYSPASGSGRTCWAAWTGWTRT